MVSSHHDLAIAQRNNRTELLRFCCALCAADGDSARALVDRRIVTVTLQRELHRKVANADRRQQ